ncbi:MAG TPA: MFS transporter [Candidatus Dormibacteraeota bacterium]|nr:MFS transporter [Candidatus Dormibacteraeota bacterium]
MSAISRGGVFASSSFRQYFAGQAFSYVGDGMRTLAVPLLVYHLTRSALSTSVSFACELGPFALFGLIGGSLADRVDRRRLMIVCDLLRFSVMTAFALAFAAGRLTLPELYGGLVAISICAAFFLGGQASSIPYLVGKSRTTQAMAALMAAENATNIVAPVAGGALFSLFGPLPALAINASTYACSQVSLALVPTLGPDDPHGLPNLREVAHDVALGFRFLRDDVAMRAVAVTSFWLNLFGVGAYAVLIPFLKRDFAASDREVGIFLGIGALGAIAGALAAGKMESRWPFGKALAAAYLVDALFFVPIVFAQNIWLAAIIWSIGGAGAAFEATQIIGWRLRVTPDEMIGRVTGALRLVVLCGIVPGVIAFGSVADRYGPRLAMAIAALGYLGIAASAALVPAIRNERR